MHVMMDLEIQAKKSQVDNRKEDLHPHTAKHVRVFLVEDDPDMCDVMVKVLERRHIEVHTATDPFEAILKLQERHFDLLILDWNLPELNGGETLLKAEKILDSDVELPAIWQQKKMPVVIFTADDPSKCNLNKSSYFNYMGYVSKRQSLDGIVSDLMPFLRPQTL